MRLDIYLKDSYKSRNKIQSLIKNGKVKVNDKVITKCGFEVNENDIIAIEKEQYEFVSRGGYKLLKAINFFNLDFKDKVVLDIGSSSGGFTDCALKFNAKKVYALDVGKDQLDLSLRNNPKVISLEETNFKDVDLNLFSDVDIIVMDVSFISITKMFNNISKLLTNDKYLVSLIKPQFECHNEGINKNGLVRDKNVHLRVLKEITDLALEEGIYLNALTYSPIKGEKSGNIEYLGIFSKKICQNEVDFAYVINEAYKNLK